MEQKSWRQSAEAGDLAAARLGLRSAFEARTIRPADAAREAEALGDLTLALRAWQLVVRDDPQDTSAWAALAALHELRGDAARGAECRRRAGLAEPDEIAPTEEPTAGPTEADLVRFCALFSGREGVHARMWKGPEGHGYSPVERALGPDLVRLHLAGDETLGIYLVRVDNRVSCACFDLDATKAAIHAAAGDADATRRLRSVIAEAGQELRRRLVALGMDPLLVDSGWKGRHAWVFFPEPLPAAGVLEWGRAMVAALRPASAQLHLEFFPKQARVEADGKGNLVKLPLGLHLVSGRRAALLDDSGAPLTDPWPRIRSIQRTGLPIAPEAGPEAPPTPDVAPFVPAPGPGDWTEADFEASTEVGPVYRGCAVIRSIVEQALRERRLSREETVVLEHSLGHGPDGVRAVNYLLERVPGMPGEVRMQSPHRGSPISCARVRQRAPVHARRGCACPLVPGPGEYANPLLHREEVHPARREPGLDDLLEQLARAEDRERQLRVELGQLRAKAIAALDRSPGGRWAARGGEWGLVVEDGVTLLRFFPG